MTIEKLVDAADVLDLAEYVELSGFPSVKAWQNAIGVVHGEAARSGGHLYRVLLVENCKEDAR